MPPINKSYKVLYILLICALSSLGNKGYAQLCTGSLGDPVVKIDFGSGTATHAGALSGTTSYTYTSADFPPDGSYTVENSTAGSGSVWWSTTDHTGNTGGYMMVVNASVAKTDYFYKSTVTGLCPGTTFEFAAWVVNLLRSRDISPPDITFTISTTSGTVLATYDTGTIPLTPSGPVWKQYGTYFTTPAGVTDVVIQMTNNSAGGAPANDLALDDITFRPCGPTMSSSFVSSSSSVANSCAGVSQGIALTSVVSTGYVSPVYQWQVNSGSAWADITGATTPNSTISSPTVAGTYLYRLVSTEAANAGSVSCQVASNQLTLTVVAAATPDFKFTGSPCLGSATTFTDLSAGATVSSWAWTFGDGGTSTSQNPVHTYAAAGTYPVTLTITNPSGCQSSTTQSVHINAMPTAAFTASAPDCQTRTITITDSSTPGEGTIISWLWDFGDGTTVIKTDNTVFTHQYATTGSYNITLTVTSSTSCTSTAPIQQLTVHPLPVISLVLPDVCTNDATAAFANNTTIADGSLITYAWTFGDGGASTLQNPNHKYANFGNYNIKLIATSAYGCPVEKDTVFTVNGDTPVAKFTVQNSANLCSSADVVFDASASSVNFGSITKMVWYFDYGNNPTVSVTYTKTQIPANKIFTFNYGLFNSPATKNYQVRMVAFSGGSACSSVPFDATITVKANPIVTISAVGQLCQEASAVQIVENKNGFTGTGVFSGTGVSATGLFDPAVSGPGTFTVNYTFTAANTCGYSTSEDITVYPTPKAYAGADFKMLEGGQATLPATASGITPLTYKWTLASGAAATNLSSDAVLNPVATPKDDVSYMLTVTSANGCTASSIINISVLKTPVVPNTFTPNGDGVNDKWDIKYLDTYPGCTVSIFNRYGKQLYSSYGYPNPWDGTFNGSELPVGTYYYLIDPKNGRKVMSGSLTIIR